MTKKEMLDTLRLISALESWAMSRDEIIAMAREAGFTANCGHTDRDGTHHPAINALSASVPVQWLERFAALVAAKEREACAQVCESWADEHDYAGAIRARGKP